MYEKKLKHTQYKETGEWSRHEAGRNRPRGTASRKKVEEIRSRRKIIGSSRIVLVSLRSRFISYVSEFPVRSSMHIEFWLAARCLWRKKKKKKKIPRPSFRPSIGWIGLDKRRGRSLQRDPDWSSRSCIKNKVRKRSRRRETRKGKIFATSRNDDKRHFFFSFPFFLFIVDPLVARYCR